MSIVLPYRYQVLSIVAPVVGVAVDGDSVMRAQGLSIEVTVGAAVEGVSITRDGLLLLVVGELDGVPSVVVTVGTAVEG